MKTSMQFLKPFLSIIILMVLVWQANANGPSVIVESNFDDLKVGTPPDNETDAEPWQITYSGPDVPMEYWEDFPEILTIVSTDSFDADAKGNSLRVETMGVNTQAAYFFDEPIFEEEVDLIRASFDVYIPDLGDGRRGAPYIYLGGSYELYSLQPEERGPMIEWDRRGRLQSLTTENVGGRRTVVGETPLDEWQHVRLDIDLLRDTYDIFWSAGDDELALVKAYEPFQLDTNLELFDRIEIATFPTDGNDPNGVGYVDNIRVESLTRLPGDANLDGEVSFSDFLALSENYGERGGWSQGDFDINRRVEFADFLILSENFGTVTQATSVPEPTGFGIVVGAFLTIFGHRKRRSGNLVPPAPRISQDGSGLRPRLLCVEGLEQKRLLTTVGFTQHEILTHDEPVPYGSFLAVSVADINGDGDLDIISAFGNGGDVAWFENTNGLGAFTQPKTIDNWASGAFDLKAADVDGDGDQDVIAALASESNGALVWYENLDGQGVFGNRQTIALLDYSPYGTSLDLVDLDGDADLDVVTFGSGFASNWYENQDGLGTFTPSRTISDNNVSDGFLADMDGDGDLDVLSAGVAKWYENTIDTSFRAHRLNTDPEYDVDSILAADMDNDGDQDIVTASFQRQLDGGCAASFPPQCSFGRLEFAWYENTEGPGNLSEKVVIATAPSSDGASHLNGMVARDIDNDGDLDLLFFSSLSDGFSAVDELVWHENTDGTGTFADRQVITTNTNGIQSVVTGDVDQDGDLDLISASAFDGRISWYQSDAKDSDQRILGDANGDGEVAFADFLLLSANYGKQVDAVWSDGDFNEDGKVDFADFLVLAENFGRTSITG